MKWQNVRLELQLNVNLCGVQSYVLGAQDDKKCHLIKEAKHPSRSMHRSRAPRRGGEVILYLRVSFKRISQLTVGLRVILIGCADDQLFRLVKKKKLICLCVKVSHPSLI